jgi:hypothetical protein
LNIAASQKFQITSGSFTQTAGVTRVDGTLAVTPSSATIQIQGGVLQGSGTISNNVSNSGTVAPGDSPGTLQISGNYTQTSAGTLQIEIGGTTAGTQYDQLHVSGAASLNGALQVVLVNGFSPASGDSFDILDWGTLSGKFSAKQLPSLTAPLGWDLSHLYTTGVITASSYVPGDIDRDGHLNVADVAALENALADLNAYQSGRGLINSQLLAVADLSGDNHVTNVDLQALINLLADGSGSAGGSIAAVPEPASWFLVATGFVFLTALAGALR